MKKNATKFAFGYILFTFVVYNKVDYAKSRGDAPTQYEKAGFPMDRTRLFPRLCFVQTALLALLGAVVRSVCMLTQFDTAVGYFNKSPLVALSDALYFLSVIAAVIFALRLKKGSLPAELNTRLRAPAAYLWGLALVVFTVGVYLVCYEDRTNKFVTVPMVLGVFSSLYFFLSGNKQGRYSDGIAALGFIPVVWCVTAAWETYTDQFTAMNSPVKISLQMGFLGLALILISELRFRLGKPLPRFAAALMSIGVFFSLNGGVPILVGTGARVLANPLHVFYAAVLLCGGLYGAYTLFQFLRFPAEVIPDDPASAEATNATPADIPADTPNAE